MKKVRKGKIYLYSWERLWRGVRYKQTSIEKIHCPLGTEPRGRVVCHPRRTDRSSWREMCVTFPTFEQRKETDIVKRKPTTTVTVYTTLHITLHNTYMQHSIPWSTCSWTKLIIIPKSTQIHCPRKFQLINPLIKNAKC